MPLEDCQRTSRIIWHSRVSPAGAQPDRFYSGGGRGALAIGCLAEVGQDGQQDLTCPRWSPGV
ncbi:MAG TPA: hypothetical protein DCY42_06305 [Chloroflexi bacterium]|nr:hypothetical protein [Chloroflexota bacterium]